MGDFTALSGFGFANIFRALSYLSGVIGFILMISVVRLGRFPKSDNFSGES
jgi:hypothetical protein